MIVWFLWWQKNKFWDATLLLTQKVKRVWHKQALWTLLLYVGLWLIQISFNIRKRKWILQAIWWSIGEDIVLPSLLRKVHEWSSIAVGSAYYLASQLLTNLWGLKSGDTSISIFWTFLESIVSFKVAKLIDFKQSSNWIV